MKRKSTQGTKMVTDCKINILVKPQGYYVGNDRTENMFGRIGAKIHPDAIGEQE